MLTIVNRFCLVVMTLVVTIGMFTLTVGFFQLAVEDGMGLGLFFTFMGLDCLAMVAIAWYYTIRWWKPVTLTA